MTPNTPIPPAVICAENIAFLHLLHSVPVLPSHNSIERIPIRQDGYTLPFLQEQRLVGTLAFLSNLKDGPDHIPAVCVEEDPNLNLLSVLLAVNKARPSDGNEVLQELKQGFEEIFTLMSKVSDGESIIFSTFFAANQAEGDRDIGLKDDIFTAIISMCSVRILCRFRWILNSKKRQKRKQPIKELLQEAISALRRLEHDAIQNGEPHLNSTWFVEGAREAIRLVDAWNSHRNPVRLKELVEGVYRLWQAGNVSALISTIPNRLMDPSGRKNLMNTISKVARYREAARFLYRTARKFPLTRHMKAVLINLPESAFQKNLPANGYTPTLTSTVARIGAQSGQQWSSDRICRLLKANELEASDQFTKQTQATMKNAKIHAEIQLVFYCDSKASVLPPRVVCSTKDACFLCNTFILMHGKMHTPRSHGRLYTGWRLPSSSILRESEQRFNDELAFQIRKSFKTLLSRKQKTVYPDPHESTLLSLPVSASTLLSMAGPKTISEVREVSRSQVPDSSVKAEEPIIPSDHNANHIPRVSHEIRNSEGSTQPLNNITPQTLSPGLSSSPELQPDKTFHNNNPSLCQGEILSSSIESNQTSPLYTTGSLEVQVENSTGPLPTTPNDLGSKLSYKIEWLTPDEAKKVLEQEGEQPYLIINAESMTGEISHKTNDLDSFYIMGRGCTLRILLQQDTD